MMLVSLEQAKAQVLVDQDADDAHLTLLVAAASRAVFTYLKDGVSLFTDSSGQIEVDSSGVAVAVPEDIMVAVLYLVGIMYKDRDENPQEIFKQGYLPFPVTALLYPYRDPALA